MCVTIGIGAAAAIGGGALLGGVANAIGAKSAADQQRDAAQSAENTQMAMFNKVQQTEQPYVGAGNNALSQLQGIYGLPGGNTQALQGSGPGSLSNTLSNLPGYQFQLQQGEQATKSNLAAQGLLGSGLAQKELMQFGQGVASNYLGQYTGGLQNLAGMGEAAAGGVSNAAVATGQGVAGNQIYAGNAAASGTLGQTQAISGALGQFSGLAGLYSGLGGQSAYSPQAVGSQITSQQGGLSTLANGYNINTPGYVQGNTGYAGPATTYPYNQ